MNQIQTYKQQVDQYMQQVNGYVSKCFLQTDKSRFLKKFYDELINNGIHYIVQ